MSDKIDKITLYTDGSVNIKGSLDYHKFNHSFQNKHENYEFISFYDDIRKIEKAYLRKEIEVCMDDLTMPFENIKLTVLYQEIKYIVFMEEIEPDKIQIVVYQFWDNSNKYKGFGCESVEFVQDDGFVRAKFKKYFVHSKKGIVDPSGEGKEEIKKTASMVSSLVKIFLYYVNNSEWYAEKTVLGKRNKKQRQGLEPSKVKTVIHIKNEKRPPQPYMGGKIDYLHTFSVRGHWRKCSKIGKDRRGVYRVPHKTWVSSHNKGSGEFINKMRVIDYQCIKD